MSEEEWKTLDDAKMCPKCYERNLAWSMYDICPFCGAKCVSVTEAAGPDWVEKLVKHLEVCEVTLGRHDRLGKEARRRLQASLQVGPA